jgi:hypothetical protein
VKSRLGAAMRGEVGDLVRIGVRQAHRIAAPPVEGAFKVDDLRPPFPAAGGEVLPDLPIHGRLESVFHRQRAPFDEEVTLQRGYPHHPRKIPHERGVLDATNIRIGHLDGCGSEKIGPDFRAVEIRMVEADGLRSVEAIEVNPLPAGGCIHKARAATPCQVKDELKTIHQNVPFELGNDRGRGHSGYRRHPLCAGNLAELIGGAHAWAQHCGNPRSRLPNLCLQFKANEEASGRRIRR